MDPQPQPAMTPPPANPTDTPTPAKKAGPPAGLLEALVAGCVLMSLSGIVMPIVGDEVHTGRMHTAQADTIEIAEALQDWTRSTLFLPTGRMGRTNIAWLYGPGEIPVGNPYTEGGDGAPLADALLNDTMAGDRFVGGYIGELRPDPWGHAYLVNADGWLDHRERAVVLSAGPNGRVDTMPESIYAQGDDILYPLD